MRTEARKVGLEAEEESPAESLAPEGDSSPARAAGRAEWLAPQAPQAYPDRQGWTAAVPALGTYRSSSRCVSRE
jgi:hypothetical protein